MEISQRIEQALDNIRPYLIADGGNVKLLEVDDQQRVFLELTGNCSTCPMSTMTLKAGVEDAIKRSVPEIKEVIAINVSLQDVVAVSDELN